MPLLLNTPDVNGNNTIRIESYTVYGINESDVRISLIYGAGTTDAGVYTAKASRKRVGFVGGNIVIKMDAALAAGETIYGATKKALYELLQEKGYVGAGTVT